MTLLARQQVHPGALKKAYSAQLEKAVKGNLVGQIIGKNPAVFKKKQQAHQKVILNRLGWIDIVDQMSAEVGRMESLVLGVKNDGLRHVFILGMGGSSLGPEVFGEMFGKKNWIKSYTIVDTTAPSQLEAIIKATDFRKAFFIVSSKSGTTIETVSQFRYFFRLVKELRPLKAGQNFAAITDSGSDLHRIARRNRFREIFLNNRDIGGRYSALSFFGLVPAAFTRVDLRGLIEGAKARLAIMKNNGNDCDALHLGLLIGAGAANGVDKLRFRTTPSVSPFIAWVEQLVAESTGKELKGVVPVEGNIDGGIEADDIIDVYYSSKGERVGGAKSANGSKPHVTIELPDSVSIGGEMLKWKMATAVASSVLGVNPFDEPNVTESKKNAKSILHSKRGPRRVIIITPLAQYGTIDIVSASGVKSIERKRRVTAEDIFTGFLAGVKKEDFVAFLSYTERSPAVEKKISRLRELVEKKYNLVTLRGYGPRFLHSTGQLFKGGSQKGHYVVLERDYETDYDIPGMNITFGRLIKAQALGDIKAMRKRKRPVVNVNLKLNPVEGLNQLIKLVESL